MDSNKVYAWDKRNGQVVYRIPGMRYGDGQVDTDDNPIWLLGDESDVDDISTLPDVVTDHPHRLTRR
jgi:hypothetical protein